MLVFVRNRPSAKIGGFFVSFSFLMDTYIFAV
nr:MAG TPA: hypothetical protein [Caudoviricetes sp.]